MQAGFFQSGSKRNGFLGGEKQHYGEGQVYQREGQILDPVFMTCANLHYFYPLREKT